MRIPPRARFLMIGLVLASGASSAQTSPADSLLADFQSPPEAAKPRVWWHWMDGNVTRSGISRDLGWMRRVGVGGVDVIETSFGTPPAVRHRLVYGSHEWQSALRFAVSLADSLGLEVSINSGPGWSGTGGSWVKPRQAMKKLVWSTTSVEGGARFTGKLAMPPATSGPFQNVEYVPRSEIWIASKAPPKFPDLYADTAVIAYRDNRSVLTPAEAVVTTSQGRVEAAMLNDGDLRKSIALVTDRGTAWVQFSYDHPQTMRSAVLAVPDPKPGAYADSVAVNGRLESQDAEGRFHLVATLNVTIAPQVTVTFEPVTASVFRFVVSRPDLANSLGLPFQPSTAGVDVSSFPTPARSKSILISELVLLSTGRVHEFERKAGFALADDYYALDTPRSAANAAVSKSDVLDLSGRMMPDGSLDWVAPPGHWTVLRLGYSLTGMVTYPTPAQGTGLEIDKLNSRIAREYMESYLDSYARFLPKSLIGERGLRAVTSDSTEAGPQNWTDDMLEQFQRLRGYDPRPWLPSLTGVIVESAAASDRFLWDFRRTIAQLRVQAHEDVITEIAHARGMKKYGEALENGRPELADDMEMRRSADVPMAAMWAYPPGLDPPQSYVADDRGAASVAHLHGRQWVAGESFTSVLRPWGQSPRDLKPVADLEFALGINRIFVHTSVHQPNERPPGLALGIAGQYFNRLETWAEQAGPWMSYLARSSFLLQQGRYAADVAYFYGEEAPLTVLQTQDRLRDAPKTYGFDFVNADALLHLLQVHDGYLTTQSGMRYRVLQLGGTSRRMTLAVLRKLREFVTRGAIVVGEGPTSSPSLADNEGEFVRLKAELWGTDGAGARVGHGQVFGRSTVEEVLGAQGLGPDLEFSRSHADTELMFLHRILPEGDIYFLTNRRDREEALEVSFRVTGRMPELWHAETGAHEPVSYRIAGGRTVVPLKLEPYDALFVVFRSPASAASNAAPEIVCRTSREIKGPWSVSFQPGRGAPGAIQLDSLSSWSLNADSGVRFFSGTATYTNTIDAPEDWFQSEARVMVDLGDVRELAEMFLNDQSLGISWKPPFSFEVTNALHPGTNTLQVKVTNLWVNRLIGDKQPGAIQYTSATAPTYTRNAPLRLSGLLGPVAVRVCRPRAAADGSF